MAIGAGLIRAGLFALAGGTLTGLAVLTGRWWLAVLGVAAVAAAVHGRSPRLRFMMAFAAGTAHMTTTSMWVAQFSVAGAALLIALQATGWGLAGAAASRRAGWAWPFAAAMSLSEWARGWWPLGGYPLSQLWLSQADGPAAALAPVVGPLGITAAVTLAGAAVAAIVSRPWDTRAPIAAVAGVGIVTALAGTIPLPDPAGHVEVAAVQGGGARGYRPCATTPRRSSSASRG